jgi:ribosome-binding protein aMBF1 (putative translation factor)
VPLDPVALRPVAPAPVPDRAPDPAPHPLASRRRPAEPPLRVLVGAVLRGHRERQGRTLRDVAEDARVSVPYLSEVERGRKEASSEVLAAVCRALGLRLVDLVGDAHAHLARAEGRVVLDLAGAPGTSATVVPLRAAPAPSAVLLAA